MNINIVPNSAGKIAMIHDHIGFTNGDIIHPRVDNVGLNSDGTSSFGVDILHV